MLEFVVPGLFQPLRLWRSDFAFEPAAPSILRLCAGARCVAVPVQGLENTLFAALGHCTDDELPFAYYRYCLDFGVPPTEPLVCADPVWMCSGIDQVTLNATLPTPDHAAATQLQALLNAHLAQDGLRLVSQHPQRWYLLGSALTGETAPRTVPLSQALGQSVFALLPQRNRRYWHRLLNEIQMLLHDNPHGINALWLWGVSDCAQPPGLTPRWDSVIGNSVTAQTVALAANVPYQAATALAQTDYASGKHLVILEDLALPALGDNPTVWQTALDALQTAWFEPALVYARNGQVTLSSADGREWHCQPPAAWQFWQPRLASWAQLLESA